MPYIISGKNRSMSKLSEQENENNFLFDDCPICQAMKEADANGRSLTMKELKKAFKKAKKGD